MKTIRGLLELHDYLENVLNKNGHSGLKETIHFTYGEYVYRMNQNTPYFAINRLIDLIDYHRPKIKHEGSTIRYIFMVEGTETGPAIRLQHDRDSYYFYRFYMNALVPSRN